MLQMQLIQLAGR